MENLTFENGISELVYYLETVNTVSKENYIDRLTAMYGVSDIHANNIYIHLEWCADKIHKC